jgi:hypothetical protein
MMVGMKNIIPAALAAALILVPLGAGADPLDAPNSSQNPAASQAFAQVHARIDQLHAQARVSALNALTPAHRNLLAQVVGQLAISPNPDVASAARVLDTNLGPSEGQALVSISTSLRQQTQQLMATARQQMINSLPPGSQPTHKVRPMGVGLSQTQNDPGLILLHLTIFSIGHSGPGHFGG